MDFIKEIFNYISGLGSYVMIPIMITIVGLIVRLHPIKALKAGITVGIGLIGLDLVLGLIWTNIGPVANIFVEKFNLNLTTIDTGWGATAGLAFSTIVGSFIIPFIILVNVLMLATKLTRTVNIDIWNYWHYAFTGAVVYMLTNNLIYAFMHKGSFIRTLISGTIMMSIVLSVASFFAPMITKFAQSGAVQIPEGAVQVTALSAGNLFSFVMYELSRLGIVGVALIVVLAAGVIYLLSNIIKKRGQNAYVDKGSVQH